MGCSFYVFCHWVGGWEYGEDAGEEARKDAREDVWENAGEDFGEEAGLRARNRAAATRAMTPVVQAAARRLPRLFLYDPGNFLDRIEIAACRARKHQMSGRKRSRCSTGHDSALLVIWAFWVTV